MKNPGSFLIAIALGAGFTYFTGKPGEKTQPAPVAAAAQPAPQYTPAPVQPRALPHPVSYRFDEGGRLIFRYAGVIQTGGRITIGDIMQVYCADGGGALGQISTLIVGLNGYSTSLRRGGELRLSDGSPKHIVTTERPALAAAGLVSADADPITYNQVFSEGLALAKSKCSF